MTTEPRVFTQSGDGPIFDRQSGRGLIMGSPTYVLVNDLMRRAANLARVTGSIGGNYVDTVLGVEIRVEWSR